MAGWLLGEAGSSLLFAVCCVGGGFCVTGLSIIQKISAGCLCVCVCVCVCVSKFV